MGQYVIPAVAAIIVALIEAIAAKDRRDMKKRDADEKETEKRRTEEALLSMKLMDATLQLSVVSANALTNGHNNGNVEKARSAAEEASKEYQEFLTKLAVREMQDA